jgi:hypothetical protein
VAVVIRSELRFDTVVVNLLDRDGRELRAAVVLGDDEARAALLGSASPWREWQHLLGRENERCGALWLPAGSQAWSADVPTWSRAVAGPFGPDAWNPEDMLLLPLRDAAGQILGVVSVDEPISGLRPADADIEVLMAVADHAVLAIQQAQAAGAGGATLRVVA